MTVSALAAPAAAHVARLDAALVGPRRIKRDLIQEVSDHLEDAIEANQTSGRTSVEAAELAVRDFGTVDEVARPMQATLALASARRTALILFCTLAIQPFLWDSGLQLAVDPSIPEPDGWLYVIADDIVEWGGFMTLCAAVIALLGTGVGQRWVSLGRQSARVAALVALAVAAVIPIVASTMMVMGGNGAVAWLAVIALLGLPMALVARSARHTLAASS